MIPSYQNYTLDYNNRIKKRVIKSLDKAYADMEPLPDDDDGSSNANNIYNNAEQLLRTLISLYTEAMTYFDDIDIGESNYTISDNVKGIVTKVSTTAAQLVTTIKAFEGGTFNYLEANQVEELASLFSDLYQQAQSIQKMLQNTYFGKEEQTSKTQLSKLFGSGGNHLVNAYNMFKSMEENYSPAVVPLRKAQPSLEGGYMVGRLSGQQKNYRVHSVPLLRTHENQKRYL